MTIVQHCYFLTTEGSNNRVFWLRLLAIKNEIDTVAVVAHDLRFAHFLRLLMNDLRPFLILRTHWFGRQILFTFNLNYSVWSNNWPLWIVKVGVWGFFTKFRLLLQILRMFLILTLLQWVIPGVEGWSCILFNLVLQDLIKVLLLGIVIQFQTTEVLLRVRVQILKNHLVLFAQRNICVKSIWMRVIIEWLLVNVHGFSILANWR